MKGKKEVGYEMGPFSTWLWGSELRERGLSREMVDPLTYLKVHALI